MYLKLVNVMYKVEKNGIRFVPDWFNTQRPVTKVV